MLINCVEIQNFRKLKSVRIDFTDKTTLFVGANNSGKTTAMIALGHFLVDHKRFHTNDFTLSNLARINAIGSDWESQIDQQELTSLELAKWEQFVPSLDLWLQVAENEIHHVRHLLPTLDWAGGLIGVRLRLEPRNLKTLHSEFITAALTASQTRTSGDNTEGKKPIRLWPRNLADFLGRRLGRLFMVRSFVLDPVKLVPPQHGIAKPQPLPSQSEAIEGNPFKDLIKIDEINAQRGFADAANRRAQSDDGPESRNTGASRRLSEQLKTYYANHLDPTEFPEPSDLEALAAIESAEALFDERLKIGFSAAFKEVEGLGYPGVTDPKIIVATRLRPTDGLSHSAAVQYEVLSHVQGMTSIPLRLPEDYNGLGYQNLISMIFKLMGFRDAWMEVGKAGANSVSGDSDRSTPAPLHLVLIEEPEAHLHAQVQQVFIRKAFDILRAHQDLRGATKLRTQLLVSTHSSHVAHECDFASVRYFRRLPAEKPGDVPVATVVNLREVFGVGDDTERFVRRYLRATHSDLFFADAAILVEGPAERILMPHFIRSKFQGLDQRYITILEIGGSHAHTGAAPN